MNQMAARISVIVLFAVSAVSAQEIDGPASAGAVHTGTRASTLQQAEQAAQITAIESSVQNSKGNLMPQNIEQALLPDIYKPEKESYVATIELAHLSWPKITNGTADRAGARLALGIARPQYTFRKELRMTGSLDLKIEGIFHGVLNSARVTVLYDMRRSLKRNDMRMKIAIDRLAVRIGLPFGG